MDLTLQAPLILRINGKVHSLKNDRETVIKENARGKKSVVTRPNNDVINDKRRIAQALTRVMDKHGLSMLGDEEQIYCYAELGFFASKSNVIPEQDVDNVWTTIQESFMNVLIRDDKQVRGFLPERVIVADKTLTYQKVYIWKVPYTVDNGFYHYEPMRVGLPNLNMKEVKRGNKRVEPNNYEVETDGEEFAF